MNAATRPATPALVLAVCGLGNIGGQVVQLLSGVPGLSRVILVDDDRYSASNVGHQRMAEKDVGRLKVKVQARALASMAGHIAVDACGCRIESVPLGKFRHCVILSCVDSRAARQSINRIAFRHGVPWIDAALDRAGSVRARVFVPQAGECLECNWGEQDYALLEQRSPCKIVSAAAPATAAPIELGAIAAGLQIALVRQLLTADSDAARDAIAHQQWFLDQPSGRGWIGRYSAHPECRFDHARWTITPLAQGAREITLRDTFGLTGTDAGETAFSVDGQIIVRRLRCPQCRNIKRVGGRLLGRLTGQTCKRCGGAMMPAAMDAYGSLTMNEAGGAWLDRPLSSFGLVAGDVISLHTRDAAVHFELGNKSAETH